MPRGQKARYNYGKTFEINGNRYAYRYTDKKKSTKTLVHIPSKKPANLRMALTGGRRKYGRK